MSLDQHYKKHTHIVTYIQGNNLIYGIRYNTELIIRDYLLRKQTKTN